MYRERTDIKVRPEDEGTILRRETKAGASTPRWWGEMIEAAYISGNEDERGTNDIRGFKWIKEAR